MLLHAVALLLVAAAPPAAQRTDLQLEQAIRARFAKSKIAVNHFQVRVKGGVATIDGKTDVIQHKGTATRLARAAGAAQVVNRVQIGEAARAKAAARLRKNAPGAAPRARIKPGGTP